MLSVGGLLKTSPAYAGDFGADLIKMVSLSNTQAIPLDLNTRSLFGSGEKKSKDISAFTKWNIMFKRFENEFHSASNEKTINSWRSELEPLRNLSLEEKVIKVNQMMNDVRYASDNNVWGKSDFWATPIEFLQKGSGDCEDYAISKYASLEALGVPEERMRVVILQDTSKNLAHAILAVYTDSGVMILDNQAKTVKYDIEISNYKPIYSINRSGWWLHKNPTVIASR